MNGTARAPASRRGPSRASVRAIRCVAAFVGLEVHELDQVADRHRSGGRLGAVVLLLEAQQHRRIAPGGVEPAGAGFVPEQPILGRLHLARPRQPGRVAGRLQELETAPDDGGVVLAVAVDAGVAGAPAAVQRLRCRAARGSRARTARRGRRGRPSARRARGSAAPRIRPARAIAAIIRPFHDVSTLSSSDGRGRRLRAAEQHRPGPRHHVDDLVDRPPDARGDVLEGRGGVEQVPAGELLLRIEGRVAAGLEAEALRHDARVGLAEQALDFGVRPDVERALRGMGARLPHRVGRDAVGVLGRVEPAARVGQVAIDVGQRVVGDRGEQRHRPPPATPRSAPAPAAPGRRASSRNAAPASARRPSSDGSRRRGDRACRPWPSPRAWRRPCRARRRAPTAPMRETCHARSSRSSSDGRGNFGAPPNPPKRAS